MEARLQGVRWDRGERFRLDVADLVFASGRVTALLGSNGAGKTSLLRLLAGLERPGRGSVCLGGAPAHEVAPGCVGYAFQEAVFFSGTVRRNLTLALGLRGVVGRDAARRIDEVSEAMGLAPLLDADVRDLSGGEAQRANLARTFSLHAPLTMLDEPLAQLDGSLRQRLLDDLPDLFRRFTTTTVLVTHDLEEAARLADRLAVLIGGEVRAVDEARHLLRRPPDPEVASLLGFVTVSTAEGSAAVHPRHLRLGEGRVSLRMQVRRVLDLGFGREVSGLVGEGRVAVPLPADRPPPAVGSTVEIGADEAVFFPQRRGD